MSHLVLGWVQGWDVNWAHCRGQVQVGTRSAGSETYAGWEGRTEAAATVAMAVVASAAAAPAVAAAASAAAASAAAAADVTIVDE